MKIASDIIKAVANNYGTHFAHWQPNKIKAVVSDLDNDIADKLDYSNANFLAQSLAKELNFDVTPYIVEHKYPVWVDLIGKEDIKPKNKNVVVTYLEVMKESLEESLQKIKSYADRINADFILMEGRTQGSEELEFYRLGYYLETYDRLLFLGINTYLKEDCGNLFEVVPEDKVGIHDKAQSLGSNHISVTSHKRKRMFLLQCDAHKRYGIMKSNVFNSLRYESELMETAYDCSVLVCSKKHASIFKPMDFPSSHLEKEYERWIEINIYRGGHNVFSLDEKYNQDILVSQNLDKSIQTANIVKYECKIYDDNVENTWLNDNNLIGYQDKEQVDMNPFKILVLTHSEKQKQSIKRQEYLEIIDLNSIGSKFDNSFTESRIFYTDFDYLFPLNKKYVGLVTGSWNLKYVGLNPIDQLHNWNSIRKINTDRCLICSDLEPVARFINTNKKTVLKDVFTNINDSQIKEFLQSIDIDTDILQLNRYTGVSNQIIAKREIVKKLFDFYQEYEILDRIKFFMKRYDFTIRESAYGGDAYRRRSGFFSETATSMWIAQNNFTLMPQEHLKSDWYKK